MSFLPVTIDEMKDRGWEQLDFLYVSGDAYVDHPSFGHAIITRLLEAEGYRVGIIAQPDWRGAEDFKRLGRPRYAALVSSGVIDSMVNHYTAAKKPRSRDAYSPGGKAGMRPDRAVIVYCNRIREAFGDLPIIIGGIEASLRRFAHYDYWDGKVRRSILQDSRADLLIYGMGEKPILEIASMLSKGADVKNIRNVRGTAYYAACTEIEGSVGLPSFEEVSKNKKAYARAFMLQYSEHDAVAGSTLIQPHSGKCVVQNPPAAPLTVKEMDRIYALPYERKWHPCYDEYGGVPAIAEVEFSITAHRGCYGGCSFCALNYHQGRVVQTRSKDSIVSEARLLTGIPGFKGYIHDVGGPTANFRKPACRKQLIHGACKHRQCLYPKPCSSLETDHAGYLDLLRTLRGLPGVKKVFIRSGIRYDYLLLDKNGEFFRELCMHHVSGQLKVAPEHISDNVLHLMGKPGRKIYDAFVRKFGEINKKLGKEQYLVPYLVSGHPGSTLDDAVELAVYLRENRCSPEQVQDFYPTPGTLSTCMYHTGYDPRNMKKVRIVKDPHEKAMQRALLQAGKPENRALVMEALAITGKMRLAGYLTGAGSRRR